MDPSESATPESRSVTIRLPEAEGLGLAGPAMIALVAGVGLLLLAGFMQTLVLTSDDPSEGTIDASVWFSWLGASVLSLAVVYAGITARGASHGVRVAMILAGLYFFLSTSTGRAGIISSLAGLFAGFP